MRKMRDRERRKRERERQTEKEKERKKMTGNSRKAANAVKAEVELFESEMVYGTIGMTAVYNKTSTKVLVSKSRLIIRFQKTYPSLYIKIVCLIIVNGAGMLLLTTLLITQCHFVSIGFIVT
uniref:Uncharacterized protein n=1 Tax=Anguilla anguilla TaxID=7936 RepID=A0A0E9XS38_ANGAN